MKRGTKSHYLLPGKSIFPPTYINSISKTTFQIFNDDSEHFRYEWRRFSSETEENDRLSKVDSYSPEGRNEATSILLFNSSFFKISPMKGDIWGHSSTQSIIEFKPIESTIESETAYLYNIDTGERIPYSFQGEGLPPSASFNVQQVNLGHISLEGVYEYKIILKNNGKISLNFELVDRRIPFPIINFSPTKGKLDAGEFVSINFVVEANHVGQFNETFKYKISGIKDELCPTITLFGRIIGPTFNISKQSIDFGTVSYGFLYSDDIEIENTSEIPFDFRFQLSNDATFSHREFNVIPQSGTIPKNSKIDVKVEFIPTSIQNYSVLLYFGSDKFSEQLMTIPISAKCICPDIMIVNNKINLGQLFLDYKYTFNITLKNNSNYPAKIEYIECDDESRLDANLEPLKFVGEIDSKSECNFPFNIKPIRLGHMDFTRFIKLAGSDDVPMRFDVTCLCVGPKIEISTEKVEFGLVDILNEKDSYFQIKNDSLITAEFEAQIESRNEAFSLKINSGIIQPGQSIDFAVTAYLDDSIDFNGKLFFNFKNLRQIELSLHAKGRGNGLISSINMDEIDMNYSFTGVPVYKKFQISNVTRRVQEIKWGQIKPNIVSKDGQNNTLFQFRIDPENCSIQPKQTIDACFIFSSKSPCTFSIEPVCEATVGKRKYELFKTNIHGEFVKPTIEFKSTSHSYLYIHDTKAEEKLTGSLDSREIISPSKELLKPISYSNSIKNVCELPLSVQTKVNKPFIVFPDQFYLEPNEESPFEVIFDPEFKKDFTSQKIDSKITFYFGDNPQQYFIDVHANLVFPNLAISPTKIGFGSLLKSTEDNKTVHIENIGSVPVSYFWELLPKKKGYDIVKLFDIYPIRGEIDVGGSEDIHITFYALDLNNDDENIFDGIAVCHVIGGPDYTIDLSGSSASVEYQLGPKTIDFGTNYFAENLQSNVSLTNASDIPLLYEVKLPKNLSMAFVSIEPMKGSLDVGKTQVFNLSVIPGFPSNLKDTFWIQVGRVVDEEITISVSGAFPQIVTTFTRSEDDEPSRILQQYQNQFDGQNKQESLIKIENHIMLNRLKEISESQTFKNQLKKMTMIDFDKIKQFDEFVLSKFVVDFGPIIIGEKKSFNYNIKTASPYPISFEFLTKSLNGTGFSIEPTSFQNIPPDTDLEIIVKFDEVQRTIHNTGIEIYDVPILFSEDLASMITIKSLVSIADLEFSLDHVDFETTLVGQKRTITLNLINQNLVPLEFKFENPINSKNNSKVEKQIFFTSPNSGVLPPISYQNIEITFAPLNNEDYSMSLPVIIQHKPQPKLFNLTGKGVELKLKIDPKQYDFTPTQPFDEPITFDAEISNPTDFPIEFLLPQWDLEIENEILTRKFKESQKDESEEQSLLSSQEEISTSNESQTIIDDKIKKFSICVIVNGPSKSGKTTVSNFISKMMDGLPIIVLKDVWKDLIENNETESIEYINSFTKYISKREFVRGFIIDGLNALPDSQEIDNLLITQMKQKGVAESVNKNPFMEMQGDLKISLETCLNYIIEGLTGQYIFQVALQSSPEGIEKNHLIIKNEEEKKNENKNNEEIEKILNMDEEDYLKLSEEDQRNIDQKRIEYRKKVLSEQGVDFNALLESMNNENENNLRTTSNLKNTKKSRLASRRLPVAKTPESNKNAQKKAQNNQRNQQHELSNADRFSILRFTYSLGKISKKIESGNFNFQSIDPVIVADKTSEFALRQNCNTILLDALQDIEEIEQQIKDFLPNLEELKDIVLPKFLAEPTLYIPKYCSQEEVLEHLPSIKQFKILNKEKPGDFPVFERLQSPPKTKNNSRNNSRNSSLARRKTIKVTIDKSLTQNLDEMNYTKRYNLDPGQSEQITIMYSSNEIGLFEESIIFSIDNVNPNSFNLLLTGKCSYPDVDKKPESVFGKVVNRLTNRTEYSFVSELNEFHFGALLIAKEKTKNQPFQYRQSMKLFNPSPFETQVTAYLSNANNHVWKIEDSPAIIPSGESKEIFLCFHPVTPEIYKATVNLFIKDNPEPFSYNFVAEACSPSIELSTTTLDFEKLLLKQVKKMVLLMNNPNRIQAIWKINKPNQMNGIFNFNLVEGTIPPNGSQKLEITYTSAKPQVVKKQMQVDVLDSTKQKAYQSYKIQLNAESFDVNFDFLYPKGMDNLMIGTIKANQERTLICTLKNKGKYTSNFSFSFAKPIYASAIKIEPISGTILPNDKPSNIAFTFCSKKVFHLDNETVCYLTVSDSSSGTEIAKIDVTMTVDSFYSQYSFEPKEPIEFAPIPTGKTLKKEFTISNTGCFPFEFELIPKIDVSEPQNSEDNHSKKGRRYTIRQPPAGTRSRKGKFSVGCFNLSHGEGIIQPGGKEVIVVDISSQTAKHSHNIVFLKITDVSEKDPAFKGIEIQLKGDVYVPGIDINNFSKIFPKTNLCLRYDVMKSESTAFLEDEQMFHFKPEKLGEKKFINIELININPIPCIVDASIKPSNTKKRPNASFPFKLSVNNNEQIEIPPLSTSTIQLYFLPSIAGNYSGVFKADVKGGNDPNTKMLKFDVEGVAALPTISILNYELKPHAPIKLSSNSSKTQLNTNSGVKDSKAKLTNKIPLNTNSGSRDSKTRIPLNAGSGVRDSKTKLISTNNSNKIQIPRTPSISNFNSKNNKNTNQKITKNTQQKIAESNISPRISPSLSKTSYSEANISRTIKEALISFGKTLINTNKVKHVSIKNTGVIPAKIFLSEKHSQGFSIENVDCSKEFEIQPDRIFDIAVLFSPVSASLFEFEIMIQVIDNPSSNILLHFSGEGSNEDIIFEGIPGDDNHLVFKDTCVKRTQTNSFMMKNVSENNFRFAWIENNDFHFSPRIGHLRKKQTKVIKVSFYAEKPIKYDFLKVNCQLQKIELQDEDAPDWDDSMTTVRYVERQQLLPHVDINPPADEKPKNGRKTTSFKKSALRRSSSVRRSKNKRSEGSSQPQTQQQQQQQQQQVVKEIAGDLVKVIEVKNEPIYNIIPAKCSDLSLTISSVCDFIRYEISEKTITFAPTMMFETRVALVTLKNTCNIRFEYGWRTLQFVSHQGNYSTVNKSPFSVLPKTGVIEAGQTSTFKVCFTPEEVDDFSATLQCEIPFLSQMDPPRIEVSGFSRRPLCHFNVDISDYISAGRRHPDFTFPLPEDVRVIELFSSGVGKKTVKKFEILNTTSHPYEIAWSQNKEYSNDVICCETLRACISSGIGYSISFSYLPKTAKTVESLWNFSIPEYQIQIPFLFVGRIMRK